VNKPFPDRWDWRASAEYAEIEIGDEQFRVQELVVSARDRLIVNWHWYEVDGSRETSGVRVKLRQFIALLTGKPAGGHHIIMTVRDPADAEAGRSELQNAAAVLFPDDDR
jgi:EpsI family protein